MLLQGTRLGGGRSCSLGDPVTSGRQMVDTRGAKDLEALSCNVHLRSEVQAAAINNVRCSQCQGCVYAKREL